MPFKIFKTEALWDRLAVYLTIIAILVAALLYATSPRNIDNSDNSISNTDNSTTIYEGTTTGAGSFTNITQVVNPQPSPTYDPCHVWENRKYIDLSNGTACFYGNGRMCGNCEGVFIED